jgi:hypothetical protein
MIPRDVFLLTGRPLSLVLKELRIASSYSIQYHSNFILEMKNLLVNVFIFACLYTKIYLTFIYAELYHTNLTGQQNASASVDCKHVSRMSWPSMTCGCLLWCRYPTGYRCLYCMPPLEIAAQVPALLEHVVERSWSNPLLV